MAYFGNNNINMFGNYNHTTRVSSNFNPYQTDYMATNGNIIYGRTNPQYARNMMLWNNMQPEGLSKGEKIAMTVTSALTSIGIAVLAFLGIKQNAPAKSNGAQNQSPSVQSTVEPSAQTTVEPSAQTTVEPSAQTTVEPSAQTTVEPSPEGGGNETANAFTGKFENGRISNVRINGSAVRISASDYTGELILPDGQTITDGEFPPTLKMTLPAAYKGGTMTLTLVPGSDGVYESPRGDMLFKVEIDSEGNVSLTAVQDDAHEALLKKHQENYVTKTVTITGDGKYQGYQAIDGLNNKGDIVTEHLSEPDGTTRDTRTTYNNGKIVKETYTTQNAKTGATTVIVNESDENGNVLKETNTTTYKDGTKKVMITRSIYNKKGEKTGEEQEIKNYDKDGNEISGTPQKTSFWSGLLSDITNAIASQGAIEK